MNAHGGIVVFAETTDQQVERLIANGGAILAALALQLQRGQITRAIFIERATAELRLHAHEAANLTNGGLPANAAVDALIDDRSQGLDGFAEDLKEPALSEKAIGARSALWAGLIWSAHQVGVRHADSDATWDWELDPAAEHCEDPDGLDCPSFAAGGPYTADNVPADPGDGTTPCRGNCRCRWKRHEEDGTEGSADFGRVFFGQPLHFALPDAPDCGRSCLCGMAYVLSGGTR